MGDFTKRFQDIVNDINNNIESEKERAFINEKIAEISMLNMEMMEEMSIIMKSKIDDLIKSQKSVESKINKIEASVLGIENDICDDGYDFEIICPYCNTQFIADIESKTEIKCPECQNVIELDWNNEESQGCSGHCSMCNSRCNNSFFDEFGEEINFFDDNVDDDDDDDM